MNFLADAAEYDYSWQFLKMIVSLGLLFGILFVGLMLMRRFYRGQQMRGNSQSLIKVIERRNLTQKTALYLVEVEGRSLLIGLSPQGVHPVAELPESGGEMKWVDS